MAAVGVEPSKLHVVLDIDGTLALSYLLGERTARLEALVKSSEYIETQTGGDAVIIDYDTGETERYTFLPGVPELIQYLVAQESVTFSFFSTGAEPRNSTLIGHLLKTTLKEGYDKTYPTPDKLPPIYSRQDLSKDNRKDLSITGLDLNKTFLVDDQANVPMSQSNHRLHCPSAVASGGSYEEDYKDFRRHSNKEDGGRLTNESIFRMNRIYFVAGMIKALIEKHAADPSLSIPDELPGLMPEDRESEAYRVAFIEYATEGFNLLQTYNPALADFSLSETDPVFDPYETYAPLRDARRTASASAGASAGGGYDPYSDYGYSY